MDIKPGEMGVCGSAVASGGRLLDPVGEAGKVPRPGWDALTGRTTDMKPSRTARGSEAEECTRSAAGPVSWAVNSLDGRNPPDS